jgi:hypothetical protein
MESTMFAGIEETQFDAFDLDLREISTPADEAVAQHPSLGTCFCTASHC